MDLVYEVPNFLNKEELELINSSIDQYLINNQVEPNDVGHYSNREGQTVNVTTSKELKNIDDLLFLKLSSDVIKDIIKDKLNPDLVFGYGDTGYEFHRYHPNHVCHEHRDGEFTIDREKRSDSLLRFASVVLHLNTCTSGGELIFPLLDRRVKTEAGKLVIFPPYGWAKHYTEPSGQTRNVIVTWLVYNNISINRLDKLKEYYQS